MAHRVHGQLVPVGGGDPIPLIRETMIVGRLESCDIRLRQPNVSKNHCRLEFDNGVWFLEDLGSTNGVKVNGSRIATRKVLHPDDTITIAKRHYKIEYEMPVGTRAQEEILEDDLMAQPLMEKAGLIKPRRFDRQPRSKGKIDPRQRLREMEEDD